MDAVNADGPTNEAATQIAHSRRQREVLRPRADDRIIGAWRILGQKPAVFLREL